MCLGRGLFPRHISAIIYIFCVCATVQLLFVDLAALLKLHFHSK